MRLGVWRREKASNMRKNELGLLEDKIEECRENKHKELAMGEEKKIFEAKRKPITK